MDPVTYRRATAADAAALNTALAALSSDLGDVHKARDEDILRAGFGPSPSFVAVLAEAGGAVVGAAVFSPLYSTTRGAPGAYVSDLWVAGSQRGAGVGRRLLAEVAREATAAWGADFVKLSVYHSNAAARAAYDRIGFSAMPDEANMILEGAALQNLKAEE